MNEIFKGLGKDNEMRVKECIHTVLHQFSSLIIIFAIKNFMHMRIIIAGVWTHQA